ncbi:unnamed protein product [Paramecium sonneborni]|uniref:Transmembrane protein n=1 Tax=Paramecium sonneborni TaxID=65129 RepID=A0A8S1QFA7_9CILI|nr:unnamed protein product [Paramecium sonneborni]
MANIFLNIWINILSINCLDYRQIIVFNAIHFWILTFVDAGLLLTLLYLRGQLSQIEREKNELTQEETKKSQKKKKQQENEIDKVAQKAKKDSQKHNQKNLNKAIGKQKQFQQRK